MAIFTPGSVVGQISGRIGGSIYSHNRGGPYIRNGTIPVAVSSDAAVNQKARLAMISADWRNLTDAQRLAWTTWAQANPQTNRLGHQTVLSGHMAYTGINSRLNLWGQTLLDVPPLGTAPDPLTALTADADIGAGDVECTYAPTPPAAGIAVELWACVVASAGISYVENLYKWLLVTAAAAASPVNYDTEIEERFGTLQVGMVVHVRARTVLLASGLVSGMRQDTVVVDTT